MVQAIHCVVAVAAARMTSPSFSRSSSSATRTGRPALSASNASSIVESCLFMPVPHSVRGRGLEPGGLEPDEEAIDNEPAVDGKQDSGWVEVRVDQQRNAADPLALLPNRCPVCHLRRARYLWLLRLAQGLPARVPDRELSEVPA